MLRIVKRKLDKSIQFDVFSLGQSCDDSRFLVPIWIAAEPLLTFFSLQLKSIDRICRMWDFFLVEGVSAPFETFLAYIELAHKRNFLQSSAPEDAVGPCRSLLSDSNMIASGLLRRASSFLIPKLRGGGSNETLLENLRAQKCYNPI